MREHLHIVNGADATGRRSAESPIRVILAEGHDRMRRCLRDLLDAESGVQVVAEVRDRVSAIRQARTDRPAVLVLDLGLVEGRGLDLIRRLREVAPNTGIVVITMHEIPTFAQQALSAGAAGFVLKDTADTELVDAVRSAARGERYVSPRVMTAPASPA